MIVAKRPTSLKEMIEERQEDQYVCVSYETAQTQDQFRVVIILTYLGRL